MNVLEPSEGEIFEVVEVEGEAGEGQGGQAGRQGDTQTSWDDGRWGQSDSFFLLVWVEVRFLHSECEDTQRHAGRVQVLQ